MGASLQPTPDPEDPLPELKLYVCGGRNSERRAQCRGEDGTGAAKVPDIMTEEGGQRSRRGYHPAVLIPRGSVHTGACRWRTKCQEEMAYSDSDSALKARDKGKLGSWRTRVGGPQREGPLTVRLGRHLLVSPHPAQNPVPRCGL